MGQKLYVQDVLRKGRGVYAAIAFSNKDLIELCPVIITKSEELAIIHKTSLHDYYFLWGKEQNQAGIALGYGSIYNHSDTPNAEFRCDYEQKTIDFYAISDISIGEEITIDYHAGLKDGKLWFDVV